MMKKNLCFVAVFVICLILCGCSSKKATIITNDGATEEMTARELLKVRMENEVAFEKRYHGAKIIFEGTVRRVESGAYFHYEEPGNSVGKSVGLGQTQIQFKEGWELVLENDEIIDLETLKKGDVLRVTTSIVGSDGDRAIYVMGNKPLFTTVYGTVETVIERP